MTYVSFFRTREDVLAPVRAHSSDAGCDVFFCPADGKEIDLGTNQSHLFQTGLKAGIPHGYMLQVCNRGSMGAKKSLVVGAHIIDSGYSGEILVDLHNIGIRIQTIKPGDKIAQLVMVPVIHFIPLMANKEESLYGTEQITMSDRGEGRLGSSDKNVK